MKWETPYKPKRYLKYGDTRVITRFLFLPRTINEETRWLEIARIHQTYREFGLGAVSVWDDTGWGS